MVASGLHAHTSYDSAFVSSFMVLKIDNATIKNFLKQITRISTGFLNYLKVLGTTYFISATTLPQ